jgi:hypothetical protein
LKPWRPSDSRASSAIRRVARAFKQLSTLARPDVQPQEHESFPGFSRLRKRPQSNGRIKVTREIWTCVGPRKSTPTGFSVCRAKLFEQRGVCELGSCPDGSTREAGRVLRRRRFLATGGFHTLTEGQECKAPDDQQRGFEIGASEEDGTLRTEGSRTSNQDPKNVFHTCITKEHAAYQRNAQEIGPVRSNSRRLGSLLAASRQPLRLCYIRRDAGRRGPSAPAARQHLSLTVGAKNQSVKER